MDAAPRPPTYPLAARLALALLAALLALLLLEGVASLVTGRLLVRPALERLCNSGAARVPDDGRTGSAAAPDADGSPDLFERLADAAPPRPAAPGGEPGIYATHPDPLVGYALRPDSDLAILDGRIRSDAMGLRCRPGPPPPADAQRLVVLGDSVAFGFGLDDDRVLAARIEALLAEARGPAGLARPVICRTVAIPGWNHRNAVRFLLDHWDALAPDIVVYMPIGNDLMDTDSVTESGLRRPAPDIAQADPWLSVYQGLGLAWLKPALKLVLAGDPDAVAALLGTPALDADISPESSRRYDDNAASIVLLAEELRRRGCHLLLTPYLENSYEWHLRERLLAGVPDLQQLPLFTGIPREFGLTGDPHPNADTADAMARWIAADLLARGWVPRGDGPDVPVAAERFLACRATAHTPDQVRTTSAELRRRARMSLRDVVDWRSADGLLQVLGGLNADGSAGARLVVLVKHPQRDGAALDLELAPLPDRPDLYPLQVAVEADGVQLGTLTVTAEGSTRARLPLPAAVGTGEAMVAGSAQGTVPVACEVRLVPERWVVGDAHGKDAMRSFLPLRIAATTD